MVAYVKGEKSGKYSRLAVIPGNCLFSKVDVLKPDDVTLFFMAEDRKLCTSFFYHKHKLVMILSAMRSYRDWLKEQFDFVYFEIGDNDERSYKEKIRSVMEEHGIRDLVTYDPGSKGFESTVSILCQENGYALEFVPSPGFVTTIDDFSEFRGEKDRVLMNNFYIFQRKRSGYLIDEDGKPTGGKWNLDAENRRALPASVPIPDILSTDRTIHTEEVIRLVDDKFPSHPGVSSNFYLPTTRRDALLWLDDFIENRLRYFGPYEDAIKKDDSFLFHSVLSPLLNIGLLIPDEVIDRSLGHYQKNKDSIPLSSIEGFIRQVIGWREFMMGMYHTGDLRGNFFGHHRKMNDKWYSGNVGIGPVDNVIGKVVRNGYCHHIERLMVLGNFMLLCEIDPDEVYRWFMEMFVDSYEWVMVPNVYGMSQFADGGTLSTKPYVSGSAYILRMSDHKRGEWCDIWDALYWRFIDRNRDVLSKNFRMGLMVATYDRMDHERKERLQLIAEKFLSDL
ncbi:cryptochrome/photolyase family protein [Methanolobus sp. WCC4]|uniref:cryptochrome/photolyase family protein n=1 Tax=Methanolobus sp. WCC4 TaxID=3125784 RepID=UPI0030FB64FC